MRSRAVRVLAAAALAAGGMTAATTSTASAAPTGVQSCYGSAKSFVTTYVSPYHRWPGSGSATTTSNCGDINVKPVYGDDVRTCFLPSSGGVSCNAWRWINAGSWGLAATDVKDGTKFYLQFRIGYEEGLVAY
ncbi:hypothetical protein ACWC10_37930 [Streptomyces sp. NPDC001595]|uniref:hypothetical protein n=1 Tax=Streptomyces sp. NPDC001532 TaxID=3154520 RepID=UPI00333396D5